MKCEICDGLTTYEKKDQCYQCGECGHVMEILEYECDECGATYHSTDKDLIYCASEECDGKDIRLFRNHEL